MMGIRSLALQARRTEHVCPVEPIVENASQPMTGNMTFYTFNMIFSGSCAAFAVITMLIFIITHITHFSKSNEQSKILRISLLIPVYSIVSFLIVVFPGIQVYIAPWLEFIQAICLATFFLLMCEFISPSDAHRDVFFAGLEIQNKHKASTNGLLWYRRMWFSIFQYPVVSFFIAILTDITEAAGIYCQFTSKPYFAKLWLDLAGTISLTMAFIPVIKFYIKMKKQLAPFRPMSKLLAFKLIVSLTFLEGIIFWILSDTGALNPTSIMTWADLNIGIESLVICIEMVPLSLFFFYAYSFHPYVLGSQKMQRPVAEAEQTYQPRSYQAGPLGLWAIMATLNPMDIIEALKFGLKMKSEARQHLGLQDQSGAGGYYYLDPQYDPDSHYDPHKQPEPYSRG